MKEKMLLSCFNECDKFAKKWSIRRRPLSVHCSHIVFTVSKPNRAQVFNQSTAGIPSFRFQGLSTPAFPRWEVRRFHSRHNAVRHSTRAAFTCTRQQFRFLVFSARMMHARDLPADKPTFNPPLLKRLLCSQPADISESAARLPAFLLPEFQNSLSASLFLPGAAKRLF